MIVWGGEDGFTLSSGGRYDPTTNSWLGPTSVVGAPQPRAYHTAVWTGAEMIVWGGRRDMDIILASGGRYDPVTNTWSPTSTSGAPTPRFRHTAVWTGESMVVWGGRGSSEELVATGARYDPVSDAWTPTSMTDAPSARSGHTAVWTGGLMIVWGGSGGLQAGLTGGRYALGNAVDDDGDGLSECEGDCNDVDPGAFSVPAEVAGLIFAGDAETLEWDSAAPGAGSSTVHDVIRGTLDQPAVGFSELCIAPGVFGNSVMDSETPEAGEGFWYLVRGRNICGPGPYGFQSNGTERTSAACP